MKELDRVTKKGGLSFHVFPAPLIHRLEAGLADAFKMSRNPLQALKIANQLHPYELNPIIFCAALYGTNWNIIQFEKKWIPEERGFAWAVLLKKEPEEQK